MEEDVLTALKSRMAYLPGGYDHNGRILIVVNITNELQPWTKKSLEVCINYLKKSLSANIMKRGLIVVIDAQKCSSRFTRTQSKSISTLFGNDATAILLVRSEGFWEKHVEPCAKNSTGGELIVLSKARLQKFFSISDLPEELGGALIYNHDFWLKNRINIEEFQRKFDNTINDMENLHVLLLDRKSMRPSEADQALKTCTQNYADVQSAVERVIEMGNRLAVSTRDSYQLQPSNDPNSCRVPQDLVDIQMRIEGMLNEIEKKQSEIRIAWNELEKSIKDARELTALEEGVAFVTNWILGTAEMLLNKQTKVGCDVQSCEELRREHEILEMECWDTYGLYAELLYKIEAYPFNKESFDYKDLISQKDFMDFVCRSFATRLERRRNVLITSARFFRLVSEYFDKTSEVFESLVMGHKVDDYDWASANLQKLKDCQQSLEAVEKELVKEGEKLSDMLSMPIKDALGRDLGVDYSEDIASIRDILDATIARRNIFIDSVELQKLTLEQVTYIHTYEQDAKIAIKWMDDLYNVMIRCHSHVGCNVHEIQIQKDELQTFQETGKSIYNYGCQLLEASLALRQSCKLDTEVTNSMNSRLRQTWSNLQAVSQEHMTRLRVSAVFHRSVEEYCSKLHDLKTAVATIGEIEEPERRRSHLRNYLALRERLLVEVGRMVRLGRLLKTRLREPFILDDMSCGSSTSGSSATVSPIGENAIACDAITDKLTEVADVAESLDSTLRDTQSEVDLIETNSSSSEKKCDHNRNSSLDEWNSSVKSTEDESFITASDCNCTPQSRSSSFQTASECHTSPLWSFDKCSLDAEGSGSEEDAPTIQLLNGVLSPANESLDSDHSFLSAQASTHSIGEMFAKNSNDKVPRSERVANGTSELPHEVSQLAKDEAGQEVKRESGDAIHIKVVEVLPKLTALGENIDEAVAQQKEHDELLKQLQGMPTPVEEFVHKADKLLASKRIDSRVSEVMGHTLNIVWEDILKLVHDRKHLLDLCANFHEKMGSCKGKMASLEVACKDTMIPIEVDAVQDFLNKFKQLRIDVLTTIMSALKEGNELLAQLQEIAQTGTLDSRPDHIKRDAGRAVNQVQQWLENLHDRRNMLEAAWQTRKTQLEQCLALAILAKDLDELETILMNRRNDISGIFSLGECEHTANISLQEYSGRKHDSLLLRDRALKITRTTEKLVSSGCFAGDEACSRAYSVLSHCTEYLETVDQREHWLHQSKDFFSKAEKTLSVLEKIEIDLSNAKLPPNSPESFAMFSKILNDMKAFAEEPLRLGYAILDEVGRTKPETHGVKRVLDEIENRKIYIEGICSAGTEGQMKAKQAVNNFLEQYNDLLSWLVSIAEAFLKTNNSLGGTLNLSKNFLNLHHKLMQDLEIKGENINSLLESVKPHLESLEPHHRYDVDTKAGSLHKHWIELKELVLKRVDLVSILIDFFEKAEHLNDMFDTVEKTLAETPEEYKLRTIESSWTEIKTAFGNLKAIGVRFLNTKVADPYLETKSACSSVEEILNSFGNRQFNITSSWEKWTTSITEKRETEILLEKIMNEHVEVLKNTTQLDTQLYPVFDTPSENAVELKEHTNKKLENVLRDVEKAQDEILQRITTTTNVQTTDHDLLGKFDQVTSNLRTLKTKLDNIKYDYRTLLDGVLNFLTNVVSTSTIIDQYFLEKQTASGSLNREKVQSDLAVHESFRERIMDNFRSLISQSESLIDRVRSVEPHGAREHDTDRILKLLENLRIHFETHNEQKMTELQKLQVFSNFDYELGEINASLDSISDQLQSIRGQTIETSPSAKTTSLAFEYFERTVELLEKRIENFIKSSENICTTNPDKAPYVRDELDKLQRRWDNLKQDVRSARILLDLTKDYFELYTQIDSEYRDLTFFHSSIINKIPFLRDPVEASNLVNNIETKTSSTESRLLEKLRKLEILSKEIFNEDKSKTLHSDVLSIFQSFIKLKSDISVVEERLRNEEKQRLERERTRDEPDAEVVQIRKETKVIELLSELKYSSPRFTRPLKDATIKEGEKLTFECEVVGDPEPSIEWFKDGISIQNNPDYRTSYSNGICILSIEETFAADSAKFMCRASNKVGTSETQATLSVKEQAETPLMTAPKIMKYLANGKAKEGEPFQFSCLAIGNPLPTVQWFKDDKCIDDSPDYIITYNNGEAILKFEKVYLEDRAVYTCKVTNPAGFEQCSASLNVEPLEPTEEPHFKVHLSNVMARVGQKIKLECIVAGIPTPEVYCTQNGKPYSGWDTKYENEHVTLIIPEAYPKDAGLYVITARNLAGEAYTSCNVTVKGRLPNETSDSEIASDMEPIKPSFQLPLKNVAIFEGKSVRLDCVIIGQPEPEVIWYHNQRPVKESADVQLLFQGDRCSLVIQEAYLEDAGTYKVVAINSAGEASSSCALTVAPLNISQPPATRMQSERIIPIESQPKIEKFLTDVLANEGDTVELECAVSGDPKPDVKWFLSNKELSESDRVNFVSEPAGVFKLIIKNVSVDDKGVYTVKFSNVHGDAKCFSHLNVKSVNAPENQRPQLEIEEKLICPTFKELFSDKNGHPDEVIKFECIVLGKPTPKVKWLFNDQPVHGKNFLVSTSGERQVLTIPQAGHDTVGKIACVAENEIGKATCVAYLNLIGTGVQPSTANVQNITEEHNTESSKVTIKKQIFTTTSTSQVNTVEGNIPQIEVNGAVSAINQSFAQFGSQPPEVVETRHFEEFHKTSDAPSTIQQRSIQISSAEDIIPQQKSTRKSVAPRFVSPLVGKIVDQGANIALEAIYDGFPSPEIKVQKNGEDLFDSDRIKISNKFNKVQIELSNIGVRDAGRYSITASNTAGSSTSTADVVVKKTIFPPVFGRRLQAQVAKRGERVVMDVEVTGTPEPTVTWYKDGQPIRDVLSPSEYKIKRDGGSNTLIIEKAQTKDSGKYMVKATNAGGEAQSIADFAVLEPTPERMVEVVKTVVYDDLKDFKAEPIKPESKSFHTSKTEIETSSDLHGTSESKIITEHRCTTEATMRLEHKETYLDLPQLRKPEDVLQTDHKTTSTSIEAGQTKTEPIQIIPTMLPKLIQPTQIIPPVLPKLTIPTESQIESSSISKKSAFEYFKKIQTEPIPVVPPSPEEKYTKYDDASKPPGYPSKFIPMQKEEVVSKTSIASDLGTFNLIPGTPPEIGFIPKPETPQRELISDKIKKIEESQKSNTDAPSGGVSIFPQISRKQEYSFVQQSKFESTSSSAPIFRPQAILGLPPASFERSQSPKPSADAVEMEKLWASPKPFEHESHFKQVETTSSTFTKPILRETDYHPLQDEPKPKSIQETKKIFEEKTHKEAVWVPKTVVPDLKSPSLVKQTISKPEPIKMIPSHLVEVQLEPGTPPEICFAPKPAEERRPSLVESIEQTLEQTLSREPSKVLPHSVRTMPPQKKEFITPPPLPPKDFTAAAPPIPSRPLVVEQRPLEPFPFAPAPEVAQKPKPPPPAFPSKFVKGQFRESGYESEKWKYSGSESDEAGYRPVKPPKFVEARPQLEKQEPIAPPKFELPPPEFKVRPKISGYSADTEETISHKSESHSFQETRRIFESNQSTTYSEPPKIYRPTPQPAQPCWATIHQPQKDLKTASLVKNISMKTKQVKSTAEQPLEPFPYEPEPPKPRSVKVPPPPSPSKFIKGEFRESEFSSDYEEKIQPLWKPHDSDSEIKGYRPVRPHLTPTGRRSNLSEDMKSPAAPSEFEHPPKIEGPPRPKFEPIKHEAPVKTHSQPVFKPKPVSAKFIETTQTPRQEYTTQYYTAIAGSPYHHASIATETKNTMQMREASETCQRVVNMQQTRRVIHFDKDKSQHTSSEYSYGPSPATTISPHPYITLTPTPTKFIPGEFRESDYESEVEGARIRPLWTPNLLEIGEPRYRHVNPPRPSRSTSLPRSYERVVSPMEFDTGPPEMPTKISIERPTSYYRKSETQSTDRYSRSHTVQTTKDDMDLKVGSPPKYGYIPEKVHSQGRDMSSAFRKKTSQFINDISNDLKTTHSYRPGFKRAPSEGDNKPQAYREESRVSQYGTKHIDPETGLIYFKYDFGYEFGIIFPGEGRKIIGGLRNNALTDSTHKKHPYLKSAGDIIIPVQHERTTPKSYRHNGFTSESEFSETEYESHAKKRFSLPLDINVDEFHRNNKGFTTTRTASELPYTVPVNVQINRDERPKRPPIFITPLKDIAVVIGQTSRFECIVQCDPHPEIVWAKNGFPLNNSNKHIIEFRNGVCRLTIPETYPDDAGSYSCTGTNQLGSVTTSAELLVPGNRLGVRA